VSFSSFQSYYIRDGIVFWPTDWSIESYRYIFSSNAFVRSIFVTVVYTVLGTLTSISVCAAMAYGLTRGVIGQKPIMVMILIALLFNGGMIPSYLVVKAVGLLNTIWAIILPAAVVPMTIIMLREFFFNIPKEISEAALIDGAGEWEVFKLIALPLSKPALAAFSLFAAVGFWNSYFTAVLYINDPAWWPLQVFLREMIVLSNEAVMGSQYTQNAALIKRPPPETIGMAAVLVTVTPILMVYPFLQKHFAKGVMLGSIKG
jgi:putative aldouronate transport system permease protein